MDRELKVSKSIEINATELELWETMTDPQKIEQYLFGTQAITDWEEGSPIIFQGEYDGNKYLDKGKILRNKKPTFLEYSYWSGFSGLEDRPENYSIVTYSIEKLSDTLVKLTWRQEGYANKTAKNHSEEGMPSLLENIKRITENQQVRNKPEE